ncbi:CLUMA_CG014695, isoform A [Clunio marinus]|uniref:CLUMA_CG014695, isoform A n=1 Tax=Clunio marinus TaxID=568069 RepID=A0A1J1IPU0_9DIPT|nr:CLUMA_CG014695, isoform A [Clunio marinus]
MKTATFKIKNRFSVKISLLTVQTDLGIRHLNVPINRNIYIPSCCEVIHIHSISFSMLTR